LRPCSGERGVRAGHVARVLATVNGHAREGKLAARLAARVPAGDRLRRRGDGQWELYDLRKDRTELDNLAERMPDKVKELAGRWDTWAKRCNVLNKGTPPKGSAPKQKQKSANG
jgi:hypothetical protein